MTDPTPDRTRRMSAAVSALALALFACTLTAAERAQPVAPGETAPNQDVFAVVNGAKIGVRDYELAYAATLRQKYYHRQPPEGELPAFRREVGDKLITRELLIAEGARQGIKPDTKRVDEAIAAQEKRYGASPQWQKNRDALLPGLRRELEQRTVLEQLEQKVRTVPEPTEKQLRAYHQDHPDQFTQPEQVRMSVILLKVDPSSPQIAWNKAREEAAAIVKRLAGGADFAELARLHSGDPTAPKGGDMGYLHRGMVPEAVHQVVDKLKPGMVSEPVTVLEGVAVLRLEERRPSRRMAFEDVRKRAADLWKREQSNKRWDELLARLRRTADIRILDRSRYPEPDSAKAAPQAQSAR